MKNIRFLSLSAKGMLGIFVLIFAFQNCKTRTFSESRVKNENANTLETLPLRNHKHLQTGQFYSGNSDGSEDFQRVKSAKVVLADYSLLKKDFPHLANLQHSKIDEWLVNNSAALSSMQLNPLKYRAAYSMPPQPELTEKISVLEEKIKAIRPNTYMRGAVFLAKNNETVVGLLDAKGTGGPMDFVVGFGSHSNGLLDLSEGIREFAMEKLLTRISRLSAKQVYLTKEDIALLRRDFRFSSNIESPIEFNTIQTYAVIDLGFKRNVATETSPGSKDWTLVDGKKIPVGIVLRQAHVRRDNNNYLEKRILIAALLRKFGITLNDRVRFGTLEQIKELFESCKAKNPLDDVKRFPNGKDMHILTNVQTSEGGAVVDFGTMVVHREMKYPVCLAGVQSPYEWSKDTAAAWLKPSDIPAIAKLVPNIDHWSTFDEDNVFDDAMARYGERYVDKLMKSKESEQTAILKELNEDLNKKLEAFDIQTKQQFH